MKGLVWIIGLALLMTGIAKGQLLDSKRTCVHVGYVRSLTYLAGLGSVGYERSLNDKISLQFTFAMNPFR